MSWIATPEPVCTENPAESTIEVVIEGRSRSLDGFDVARVLPAAARRMVGPFVFFDHMGPAALAPGLGMDVRPHPHIHLATVTYLFEGEILHRDSIGSELTIRPGAINWMTAGRGIVHSERTPADVRASGPRLHGLQLWIALPQAHEDTEPSFSHHPAASLPERRRCWRGPARARGLGVRGHVAGARALAAPLCRGHARRRRTARDPVRLRGARRVRGRGRGLVREEAARAS